MIGPFLVPNDQGGVSLICDGKTVPLDHETRMHWWWVLSQSLKREDEERRRKHG